MMTKKYFVSAGLFLILSGSLFVTLQSHLMISRIIPIDWVIHGLVFRYIIVPVGFSLLLWKWLGTVGRSKRFAAFSFFGTLVTYYMFIMLIGLFGWPGFDTSGILTNEIGVWSEAGGEGEIMFTMKAKLKVALLTAINETLGNWILFAALYLGASDPRFPKRNSQLNVLLKRIFSTRSTPTCTINQIAY